MSDRWEKITANRKVDWFFLEAVTRLRKTDEWPEFVVDVLNAFFGGGDSKKTWIDPDQEVSGADLVDAMNEIFEKYKLRPSKRLVQKQD